MKISQTLEVLFVVGGRRAIRDTVVLFFVHCHWGNNVVWGREYRARTPVPAPGLITVVPYEV